jgi:hypothetical protein
MDPTTPTLSPREKLHLNCFSVTDGGGFTISIEGEENVSGLKEAVMEKQKNTFPGIDAYKLQLYKVSLPYDNAISQHFRPQDDPSNGVVHLNPFESLKVIFRDLKRHHVHVIIWCPSAGECDWLIHVVNGSLLLQIRSASA